MMLLIVSILESFIKQAIIGHMLLVVSFVAMAHGDMKLLRFSNLSRLINLGGLAELRLRQRLFARVVVPVAIDRLP